MLELISPYLVPALLVAGAWVIGHFGTAKLKAEAAKVKTDISAALHEAAQAPTKVMGAVHDAESASAVAIINALADKRRHLQTIEEANAAMAAQDAELAKIKAAVAKVSP